MYSGNPVVLLCGAAFGPVGSGRSGSSAFSCRSDRSCCGLWFHQEFGHFPQLGEVGADAAQQHVRRRPPHSRPLL